jgi:hypothetical protein
LERKRFFSMGFHRFNSSSKVNASMRVELRRRSVPGAGETTKN